METHIGDISRAIQLAIAPVFLLTAVATFTTALNNRLGRIVDRRRVLDERLSGANDDAAQRARGELTLVLRRLRLIYFAILSAVTAALLVCLVIATAFVGALLSIELAKEVAFFFVLAMFALICCLSIFLREVFLAVTGGKHRMP